MEPGKSWFAEIPTVDDEAAEDGDDDGGMVFHANPIASRQALLAAENSRGSAFENFDEQPADVVTSSFEEFTGGDEFAYNVEGPEIPKDFYVVALTMKRDANGLGLVLNVDEGTSEIRCDGCIDGSAAAKAGAKQNDIMWGVDGQNVYGKELEDVVEMLKNSTVHVAVLRKKPPQASKGNRRGSFKAAAKAIKAFRKGRKGSKDPAEGEGPEVPMCGQLKIYFLDGTHREIFALSSTTALETAEQVAEMIGLQGNRYCLLVIKLFESSAFDNFPFSPLISSRSS
jgi:hypothetical protein